MITFNNKRYYTLYELAGSEFKLRPTFWGNYFAIKKLIESGELPCEKVEIGSVRYLISEDAVRQYKS